MVSGEIGAEERARKISELTQWALMQQPEGLWSRVRERASINWLFAPRTAADYANIVMLNYKMVKKTCSNDEIKALIKPEIFISALEEIGLDDEIKDYKENYLPAMEKNLVSWDKVRGLILERSIKKASELKSSDDS